MKVGMTLSGDLAKNLAALPTAVNRKVQLRALKIGAEPIRAKASILAPRDEEANAPHLADNIVISVPTAKRLDEMGAFDQVFVWIGPALPFFYGYFQEIGTAFHPEQPFMRPAFDSEHGRSLRLIASEAWAAIKGFASRSSSGRAA